MTPKFKTHVVVIGSGAAGLSAAWLLSKNGQRVTLVESQNRLGGHAHTAFINVDPDRKLASTAPQASANDGLLTESDLRIDTGFIVYNEPCYPNLSKWFDSLDVATEASDMSFAVSRDGGRFEYAGGPALGLIAQRSLLFKPRFWKMLRDLLRFYRHASDQVGTDQDMTLGEFLRRYRYGNEFVQDHLLPFGAAIWSTPKAVMLDYPALHFLRFCENHGLLKLTGRPQWRTVSAGSISYVDAVTRQIGLDSVIRSFNAQRIDRTTTGVSVFDDGGHELKANHVVIATHADQALGMLANPSEAERSLLSVFRYETNRALLHTDISFLPKRRRAWCSWNYVERDNQSQDQVSVSYWMNRLQNIMCPINFVVTLNPPSDPDKSAILRDCLYEHPVFTGRTSRAQKHLWTLQGEQRTWFCGSYFGSGFHEDAVQSGFAVAEHLSGRARPWVLDTPSTRIEVPTQDLAGLTTDIRATI